jgi:hypothetical protein
LIPLHAGLEGTFLQALVHLPVLRGARKTLGQNVALVVFAGALDEERPSASGGRRPRVVVGLRKSDPGVGEEASGEARGFRGDPGRARAVVATAEERDDGERIPLPDGVGEERPRLRFWVGTGARHRLPHWIGAKEGKAHRE